MPQGPAPTGPGRDEDPAQPPRELGDPIPGPDPITDEEWLAWCDATADQDEPGGPDEDEPDPDGLPGHWEYNLDEIVAECRQISAEEAAAAARALRLGMPAGLFVGLERRGPGQPGSARRSPGEHLSRAAGFATGMCLDTMPGCNALAGFAAEAAGEDDRYEGASDDEIAGALCAWDRVEAHASARKHAAVAELIRRRPEPGCALEGQARMPVAWDEFTADELRQILADSRGQAEDILALALLGGQAAGYQGGVPGRDPAGKQGSDHRRRDRSTGPDRGPRRRGVGSGPGGADPGRAAVRDRPRRDGSRPRKRASGESWRQRTPGSSDGPRMRERGADGPGAAPRGGAGSGPTDQRMGAADEEGRPGRVDDEPRPGPTWTSCWGKTPAPADPARTASPTMPPSMTGRTAGKVRDMAARTGRTVPQTVAGTARTTHGEGAAASAPGGSLSGAIPTGWSRLP